MPLSFQPACLPIARGGVPHTSPPHAVHVLLKTTPDVLAWPCLPRRSFREQSYVQSAIGFPGVVIDQSARHIYVRQSEANRQLDRLALAYLCDEADYGALNTEDAAGLTELCRSIGTEFSGQALKGQLLGPISLGMHLSDEHQRPLAYEPILLEALAQHLALRATWQATRLADYANDIIICLDEPFWDVFHSPFCPLDYDVGLELIEKVFAEITGCRALSIAGAIAWAAILETSVELIMVDAYNHGAALLEASAALPSFLERSGAIAWGLIPADESLLAYENGVTLISRFNRLLDALDAVGVTPEQILPASFISTSSDLDHLSIPVAEQALQLCAEVSAQLREIYQLT